VCVCVFQQTSPGPTEQQSLHIFNKLNLSVCFVLHYLEEDSDLLEVPGSDSLKLLLDVSEFLEAWVDEAPLESLLLLPIWLLEMRFL